MTLTEEQLEALDFALEYLVDDPNDDRDSNLANSIRTIRAMINSSKHVIDPTKMIGFDLEKNRAAIDNAINSLLCEGWDNEASTVRRLVAEIERLRAMIDSSEHFTDATKMIGFDLEVRWHDDYMKRFSDITAWHCGHATLWIMHSSGKQEWIPLASVRRISSVEKSP